VATPTNPIKTTNEKSPTNVARVTCDIFNDSLVDVDTEELNDVLSSSGQANVDEDNDDDIDIEDCDGADDYSIDDEEEENSD
jgi:hypothetical protein